MGMSILKYSIIMLERHNISNIISKSIKMHKPIVVDSLLQGNDTQVIWYIELLKKPPFVSFP